MKSFKLTGIAMLWLSGLIFVLDQVTKQLVSSTLALYERVAVLPFFNITLAHNEGAAFSFLADAGGWQRWLFTTIAFGVSCFILIWLYQNDKKQRWLNVALALILGGAIGNLCDRIIFGYVIDFLDFYWHSAHFPAFNVADSAISIGAFMLFLDIFFQEQPAKPPRGDDA